MANYEIRCEVTQVDTGKTKCNKVGDVFTIGLRTPAGMCCRAFHAVYPTALAMRFSDKMKWEADDGSVCIKCPDNNVLYRLTRSKEIT
jgi:uncharacterized repeat protein (TIGR04076 family)